MGRRREGGGRGDAGMSSARHGRLGTSPNPDGGSLLLGGGYISGWEGGEGGGGAVVVVCFFGGFEALCVVLRHEDARISFSGHGGVGYLTKITRLQEGEEGNGVGGMGRWLVVVMVLLVVLMVSRTVVDDANSRMLVSRYSGGKYVSMIIRMQVVGFCFILREGGRGGGCGIGVTAGVVGW